MRRLRLGGPGRQPGSNAQQAAYKLPLGAHLFRGSLEQHFSFGQDDMPLGKIPRGLLPILSRNQLIWLNYVRR